MKWYLNGEGATRKNVGQKYNTYKQKLIALVYNCVLEHVDTLNKKLEQNCYVDDYGKTRITNKFDSEVSYFVNNVIVDDIVHDLYESVDDLVPERDDEDYQYLFPTYDDDDDDFNGFNFKKWEKKYDQKLRKEQQSRDIFDHNTLYMCDEFYTPCITITQDAKTKDIYFTADNKALFTQTNNCKAIKTDFVYAYFMNRKKKEEEIEYNNSCLKTKAKKHPDYLTVLVIGCLLVLRAKQCDNTKTHSKKTQPLEYEKQIALKLKQLGFNAQVTKASGDQGADILADKAGVSFAIQCKLYTKPVGNKAVQEINTARDFYKKDFAVVVSNADFTKSARTAANACNVILINDTQLEKLLEYV